MPKPDTTPTAAETHRPTISVAKREALPQKCWVKRSGHWHKATPRGRQLNPGFDVLEWVVAEFPGEFFSPDDGNITFADPGTDVTILRTATIRVQILEEGAKLTSGDRDVSYGPPAVNLSCAGELKTVFRKWAQTAGVSISAGEQEALDQVMTKLARRATGTAKRDTYVDGATYFAIAGELSGEC